MDSSISDCNDEPGTGCTMDDFEAVNTTDYYELFNLSKEATAEEIKLAYRRLSLLFHPDKQSDPNLKDAAQRIFHKIHTAYTVLSNPKQREIYNQFGAEGIEAAWQLGPHLDQTEKIIEELKKRQSVGLLGGEILQSKTAFTIGLDASEIAQDVTEAENLVYSDFLPKVSVVGVTEVLESSIGSDNQLAASFTAVCQSGNVGSGSVTLNWRRPLLHPSLRVDNGIGFGAKKFISTALVYQIDQRTTASLQLATFLQGGTGYPQLSGSLSRAVNANFVSTAQFTVPFHAPIERGQLNFSLTNKTSPEVKSPLSVLVNIPFGNPSHSLLELKKTFNLDERHELRLKGVSSTEGIHGVNLGIHRRFNNRTRGSATIQFDNEGGVSLRLGLTHDTLHLILPVRFSQEISPVAIVLASLIPSLGDWITRRWIHPLLLERQRNQQLSEFKRKQAAMLERKQDEAEMAVELLKQLLAKKHATSAPSLLITSASYRSTTNPHQSIDVTAPIQFLVSTENVIKLPSGYRANLLGFYDVDPGMTKELHICYDFQGSHHEVIIPDTEELLIPQKQHLKLK